VSQQGYTATPTTYVEITKLLTNADGSPDEEVRTFTRQ
jgi:hypothetical protein